MFRKSYLLIFCVGWVFVAVGQTTNIYESEGPEASSSGNVISDTFSGENTLFFNGNSSSDQITFSIQVPAGTFALTINYGMPSGYGSKNQVVLVNNNSLGSINFSNSNGNLQDQLIGDVDLVEGMNTITIQADWGYMHINSVKLTGEFSPPSTELTFEAEGPNAQKEGNVIDASFGQESTVFFNGNSASDKLTFSFDAPGGTYDLLINYGMPASYGNKNQLVSINGNSLGSVSFPNTNGSLSDKSIADIDLIGGTNVIEIAADWGYMHINSIFLSPTGSPQLPAAPSNLSLSESEGDVTINWQDNAANEDGFQLERKVTGGSFSPLTQLNSNVSSYTDENVPTDVDLTYRVLAFNMDGNSAYSNEATITVIPQPTTTTYEAEGNNATPEGNADLSNFAGAGTVFLNGSSSTDKLTFTFPVTVSGKYQIDIYYGMPTGFGNKNQEVVINGNSFGSILFENSNDQIATKSIGQPTLNTGDNTLEIIADWGYMHIDKITVTGPNTNPSIECPGVPSGQEGFFVGNGSLWDNNCNEFIIRGVNHQYGDRVGFAPSEMKDAIPKMKTVANANSVRLLLRFDPNDSQGITSSSDIKDAVDLSVNNDMVPILMMYSSAGTCGTSTSALDLAASRWSQLAGSTGGDLANYENFKKYGIINVLNEFGLSGSPDFETWKNAYKGVITALRNAGYTNPIMIDAHQCAQNIDVFLGADGSVSRAQELLDHDPLHNLIFSPHAYNFSWNTDQKISEQIAEMAASGFTWVFGEHGNTAFEAPSNDVNNELLWQECEESSPKIGWVAWSWCSGNGGCCTALNMSGAWVPNSFAELLPYGQQVVSHPFGLQNTAFSASVFSAGSRLSGETVVTSLESSSETNNSTPLLFPNPFTDQVTISQIDPGTYALEVYDLQGKNFIYKTIQIDQQYAVDLSQLKSGFYLLTLQNEASRRVFKIQKAY